MMYSEILIQKYRSKGIVVDTNLLLLLAIGLYDVRRIATFKRTSKFDIQIFAAVKKVVEQFEQRFTTPYIITEVDNWGRYLRENEWQAISSIMRQLVPSFIEIYEQSSQLVRHPMYANVGVTDCSIDLVQDALIFTDDLPLSKRLESRGHDVLNVGHLVLDLS